MKNIRIHARISGRVQGVFFRANTARIARELGLNGWVRNLSNGMVEVVAEGEKEKMNKLVEFLHKGPSSARVDKVYLKEEKYRGEFEDFQIKYF